MDRRLSSSEWCLVHDVVMHEGEVVKYFDCSRLIQNLFRIFTIHAIGQKRE